MNRRRFLSITGGSLLVAGGGYYLSTDKSNFTRNDMKMVEQAFPFQADEREILYLASLAPSGHNTQPWFVKYIEPFHWIVGNDKSKWLPAVDPLQRETILSIGAFLQNMEYAASHYGYNCQWNMLATDNQSENVAEVIFHKTSSAPGYDISTIGSRRTVRSGFLSEVLRKEDLDYLIGGEDDYFHYVPNNTKEYFWLNEQTIEANRLQMFRDDAEAELARWIRFGSSDAEKYCDGLTTAGMELDGITGWVARNFFDEQTVMKRSFRNQGIDKVKKQVSQSGGWIILTGNDSSVSGLLDSGRRMQRLFLRVRSKGIALHPMTQILEEMQPGQTVNSSIGINEKIQFILRTGYVRKYPSPVSLRRPVDWFIRT